jgi:hypothetical protein
LHFKLIDYGSESENFIRNELSGNLPDNPKELTFIIRQLCINNKCIDIFESILIKLIKEIDSRQLKSTLITTLTQSINIEFYNLFINEFRKRDYLIREPILEETLQNVCTSLKRDKLIIFLKEVSDISFKNNLIFLLMNNNENENIDLILKRSEVIDRAFRGEQYIITKDLDEEIFYQNYPEYLL